MEDNFYGKGINVTSGFDLGAKSPLDSRSIVHTIEERDAHVTGNRAYEGMTVYVLNEKKEYRYDGDTWIEMGGISDDLMTQLIAAYEHSTTPHVTQSDIPTKLSDLENDSNFITEIPAEYITEEKLSEITNDLTFENKDVLESITQEDIDKWNSGGGGTITPDIDIPDEYITEDELESTISQLESELNVKFDDVQLNETETTDMQTALDFFSNGELMKTVYFSGGGGGGSTASAYISTTLPEEVMVQTGENFELLLDFASPNLGRGTLKVFINDVESMSVSINQGESSTTVSSDLLSKGTNRMVVYVLDRVGGMSNSLTFYIRYGSTEITSDFDAYSAYEYGAVIRYYFTPTALDTSLSLTFYMSIDGEVKEGVSCTSDTRGYFTFPSNLSPDSHYCEAYVIDGAGIKSNVLSFNLVILDTNTLVIASDTKSTSIEEGEQLVLEYKVYMNGNSSFITKTYIDEELVNTGTCGLDFNYYRTSSLTEGIHSVKMEVWDVTETYSDYITWTITVTPSTYEMLQPANAGAMFIASAVNKSNADERRGEFIGVDETGKEITGTLYNFAFNSESGWVDDELIISGNSHVEIPIQPLANNARYGFTLDIEFTSRQIGVEDAEVLTLWNDEKDCGIRITTERLILRSAEGNECNLYFTDDERTNAMFIIDRNERKGKIYLNGVMCEAFHLSDYSIDGVAYLEDFTVNSNLVLGGYNKNGYSKIRNLRIYNVALTTDEIINNWISCEINKTKQRELVEFQKGNDLPTLYIYCDFSGLGKDDKKPCKIVYNSTDEIKYGKSFALDHKNSTCQYQGTSSMAYPIKNYRINPVDENGKKWKYEFPFGQPESRFTLKADFMNSCHAHNTGMAKFINDCLYNYNLEDEKTMNPFKWYRVQNGIDISNYRESIYGFPCRLILINDGSTPLNEGQNEPTPGNTKDMGIFNFNHDKDATATLGFDSDIFPNCASYEVTANSDTSAGAFMSYFREIPIRYYNNDNPTTFLTAFLDLGLFKLSPGDTVYVESDLNIHSIYFHEWNEAGDDFGTTISTPVIGGLSGSVVIPDNTGIIRFRFNSTFNPPSYIKINSIVYPTKFYEVGSRSDTIIHSGSDELDYIKQSFELRYPDEDDVPNGWGFMGADNDIKVIDYATNDVNPSICYTTKIPYTYMGSKTFTVEIPGMSYTIEKLNESGSHYAPIYGAQGKVTVTLSDDEDYIILLTNSGPWETIIINDVVHKRGSQVSHQSIIKEPYDSTIFDPSIGLKALIDWVDNCTDEEFVRDFEQHFHKDYTLRYYALVVLIGAVDNLGKNMMLDTADNKIFFPRFYDIDTILSYDNSGDIKFDVDIEMEQGYWNTSSSRLWTRLRDLFHDDIVAIYNNMRQNGVSYENIMHYMYDEQISKIPQKYYNQDYDVKYAPFEDSYIGMAHGNGYEHMKRWLKNRFIFCDTLFDYAPSYNNDVLTIRANTTELMNIEIETYTPVYQHVSWYNGQMDKKKIDGKTATDFSGTAMAATDQEVLIYGGSNVKRIKGISSMNPNQMLIGSATRLIELDASGCPILADINSNKANLSPHTYLNKVDISNCPMLGGNLRLNNSPLLREVDARGTAVTGLMLPSSIRNLEILRLPNAIADLTLNDAGVLHTLELDEGVKMNRVSMTNCNALTNVINLDLSEASDVTLDNSYRTATELYFKNTRNLTLRNMPNLERIIYIPNDEYESFAMINVANASNYSINTFNCPKLSTFMTTAPYRESYNNGEYGDVQPNTTFAANDLDISNTRFTDVKLLCTTDINTLKLPTTIRNFYCDSSFDLDTDWIEDGDYDVVHDELIEQYTTDYEGEVVRISNNEASLLIKDICTIPKSYINESNGVAVSHNSFSLSDFIEVVSGTQITLNFWVCRVSEYNADKLYIKQTALYETHTLFLDSNCKYIRVHAEPGYFDNINAITCTPLVTYNPNLTPSSAHGSLIFSMYSPEKAASPASGTWDLYGLEFDNFHTFGMNNHIVQGADGKIMMPARYDDYNITIKNANIIPKTYNTMLYPLLVNEDKPITGTLDYTNYEGEYLSWSFAYVNMDDVTISQPKKELINSYLYKYNAFYDTEYEFDNPNEVARYTTNARGVLPVFNNGFSYTYDEIGNADGTYTMKIYADNLNNLPTSISFMNNSTSLLSVGKLNTTNLTSMRNMFGGCSELTTVNVTGWDTSKVTSMYFMFGYCNKLTSIIGKLDTSSVIDMGNMFQYCSSLTSLDLSNWDVSKVTTMQGMFQNCSALTSLNLSGWDVSKVTSMQGMFTNCASLTSVDLSEWDMREVTSMGNMFTSCSSLTSVNLSGCDTRSVTSMEGMFRNCSKLTEIVGIEDLNVSNIRSLYGTFYGCFLLSSLDLSGWNITTNCTNLNEVFHSCTGLTLLNVHGWDTSAVTSLWGTFSGIGHNSGMKTLDISDWDIGKAVTTEHTFNNRIEHLYPPKNIALSLNLKNALYLSSDSLVRILNNLATVSNQTLTLTSTNLSKLTADQIAIATNKGWTVV